MTTSTSCGWVMVWSSLRSFAFDTLLLLLLAAGQLPELFLHRRPHKRNRAPRRRLHEISSLRSFAFDTLLLLLLRFEPAVEPAEEEALPEDGVLGFENPVVLVGVDNHFCGNAAREPYIDGDRIGATGASYGGFSVYYLAGNHNGNPVVLVGVDNHFCGNAA